MTGLDARFVQGREALGGELTGYEGIDALCCRMEARSRGVSPMFGTLLQPVTTPLCVV